MIGLVPCAYGGCLGRDRHDTAGPAETPGHERLVTDDGLSATVVADFVVALLLNGSLPG